MNKLLLVIAACLISGCGVEREFFTLNETTGCIVEKSLFTERTFCVKTIYEKGE